MSEASAVPSPAPAPAPSTPPEPARCANCDAVVSEQFCARCGQKVGSTHVSLGHLLHEFVDDYFHLDSKLARTVLHLFRPGHLTREFLAGRRMRYVGPFKLYLTASVLFFFFWSLSPSSKEAVKLDATEQTEKAEKAPSGASISGKLTLDGAEPAPAVEPTILQVREALAKEGVALTPEAEKALEEVEKHAKSEAPTTASSKTGKQSNLEMKIGDGAPPWLKSFGEHATSFFNQNPGSARARLNDAFANHVPKALFFLLPVFALLLKALYRKSERFYPEHFVFALHFHAFTFIIMLLQLGLSGTKVG
ncbi:MAG TPA: DUF3667 domain-containing protein, partial [Myxococcaceae bacterium]|nr:DUF3667 domain-containing protein [Myxococcaceae bacterium]